MRSIITDIINSHYRVSHLRRAILLLGALILISLSPLPTSALPSGFYAASSRMATGKWIRIEVKATGMQFISNSSLRSMGFADPSKVNVFGYGGRLLPETLDSSMTDDLPIVPSLLTPSGILFFGHDNILWQQNAQNPSHTLNPYSDHSYYFLSDAEATRPGIADSQAPAAQPATTTTTFTRRLLHEQDITAPSNTGRLILGEDFKVTTSRKFSFSIPDPTAFASARICFGAKVTNGASTITVNSPNSFTTSYRINGVSGNETFLARQTFTFNAALPVEKLDLVIDYAHTGLASTAALDYIEVFAPSELRLRDSFLHFYLNPGSTTEVKVEGCSASTVIWEVTDHLAIRNVPFSLEGSTASFNIPSGYREFVAFNPEKCQQTITSGVKVANQDIHGMEAPDMLIVSPDAFLSSARALAELRERTGGIKSIVLTPEQIYNEFSSGTPDVTAFRRLLKMWRDRALADGSTPVRYCILMGRPSYDNKNCTPTVKREGYPRLPIWATTESYSETTSYSTDDYIGMLDDTSATFNINSAKIHVAVGRMPVKTEEEARKAVAKLEKYLTSPTLGSWRNNVMIIADDQDNGTHLTQAETIWRTMSEEGKGADCVYEKLYLDAYTLAYSGIGAVYPEAKARMLEKWNEGVALINYIGHGNPRSLTHENLLTWNDVIAFRNPNLPFMYAATCNFMRWDDDEVSAAETLWLNPDAGVIGMICPSRTVYITLNGSLNIATSRHMFDKDEKGRPLGMGEIMLQGKNSLVSDNNKLRYGFMGDPSLPLPVAAYDMAVETVNGVVQEGASEFPVLGARSQVELSGSVRNPDGSLADGFNGVAEISIFDAEKAITTHGNGSEGKVDHYNDFKSLLYKGRVKVEAGRWATVVNLPSEIDNNRTQALLSMYASDQQGNEASGNFRDFYIYGYDAESPADSDGPLITECYLNNPAFSDGASVSPSSVLKARFTDPSGINVSTSGIGHNMVVAIDGKTFLNDVNLYYTPDVDDPFGGSIEYPLNGIAPGEHTLSLTVWDNANNSSTATLAFNIAADWRPGITGLFSDANPAVASVNFTVVTDGGENGSTCRIEVLDLNGRTVWTAAEQQLDEGASSVAVAWNLCDRSGVRVPRGIYLYRAVITGKDGYTASKTRKLAVAAP